MASYCDKLGLGTVQFGIPYGISNKSGQTQPTEVSHILKFALKAGICLLDTASSYGSSEMVLGQNDIGGFAIVSKFLPPDVNEAIAVQLNRSLKDMGVKSLYGYLAHRPANLVQYPEQWEELKLLKAGGLIKKIGFSLNAPSELDSLLDKDFIPDLIQVPYNYFDRRFEKYFIELKKNNCEIHTRSTFLQGLFLTDTQALPSFFDPVKSNIKHLQVNVPNLSGSLLKFVIQNAYVDKVILGVETEAQLKFNISTIKSATQLPDLKTSVDDEILMPSNWPK